MNTKSERDPNKNYFNQIAHNLTKSSYYHIEESFNKYSQKNNGKNNYFSIIHVNIRITPNN